jgi:2-polyprenyl-3-methyl-5-hydroxy-6-metoxy-1,4-benzoquinol methylase
MDLVHQQYWDESYDKISLDSFSHDDPIMQLVRSKLENTAAGDVFEIGCFPGRYLNVFGEKGFVINGIDTTPRVATDLVELLNSKNYKVGELKHGDIFQVPINKQYDVVCSFGFIEHFIKWKPVIAKHMELVRKGGVVIITVPNFRGAVPQLFHRVFDGINFRRHNLKAMNVSHWKKHIRQLGFNYEVLFEGPVGKLDLWAEQQKRSKLKSYLLGKIFNLVGVVQRRNFSPSTHYSPYLGLIIKVK